MDLSVISTTLMTSVIQWISYSWALHIHFEMSSAQTCSSDAVVISEPRDPGWPRLTLMQGAEDASAVACGPLQRTPTRRYHLKDHEISPLPFLTNCAHFIPGAHH